MHHRKRSDYDFTVDRVKSLFEDCQLSLADIKDSPLMLNSDLPHLTMWISNRWVKTMFNAFCLPVDFKLDASIKPEDLEEFNFNLGQCKLQEGQECSSNSPKLQQLQSKDSASHSSSHSQHRGSDEDDMYLHDENGSRGKKDYKRGPYKNYTVEEKMAAVKMLLEQHFSVIEVSRRLRIPCKNIKRWSQYGVERKKGGGRKRFSPETERRVARKLKDLYKEGSEVEYEKVQDIARNLSDDPTFKASRGWVVKFVERQNLRNYYTFA